MSTSTRPAAHGELHVWRTMMLTWLFLALLSASSVSLFYRHLDHTLTVGDKIDHLAKSDGKVINVLVMGSDSRDGKGDDIDGLTGGGERADTTILLHVSADRKHAYGVSLPRDALVTRPSCRTEDGVVPGATLQMFNSAFSVGGPACTVKTVESLTGIYIDHYVVVDFRGFRDMVDAVGGVRVCIPEAIDDNVGNIHLDAGTQTLKGTDALNYVRERHAVGDGSDIGRMKRQQAFIASMTAKVVSSGTLTRPDHVISFLNAATKSLTLDPKLANIGKLINLALQVRHTGLSQIKFISVPSAPYEPDPNRLVWTSDAAKLWQRIKHDKGLGPVFSQSAITASAGHHHATEHHHGGRTPTPTPSSSASTAAAVGLCS